jgi:hypothetical protein
MTHKALKIVTPVIHEDGKTHFVSVGVAKYVNVDVFPLTFSQVILDAFMVHILNNNPNPLWEVVGPDRVFKTTLPDGLLLEVPGQELGVTLDLSSYPYTTEIRNNNHVCVVKGDQ